MNITTSKTPWSTKPDGDGAIILDFAGNQIGRFNDWRDAELVVGRFHEALPSVKRPSWLPVDVEEKD